MTNTPLDELLAQVENHAERLSLVEKEQLQAVLVTYSQRVLEPQLRERYPGFSLSVVLRESPYRPSDRLTEVVAMLEEWLSQPKLDSLIEAIIDRVCGQ